VPIEEPHKVTPRASPLPAEKKLVTPENQTDGPANGATSATIVHNAHHETMLLPVSESMATEAQTKNTPAMPMRLGPNRSTAAPATGPMHKANAAMITSTEVICARLQPNSASSGAMNVPSPNVGIVTSDMPHPAESTTFQFFRHSASAPDSDLAINAPSNSRIIFGRPRSRHSRPGGHRGPGWGRSRKPPRTGWRRNRDSGQATGRAGPS
jgi:hypothetical protein